MPIPASALMSGVNSKQYMAGAAKSGAAAAGLVFDMLVLAVMFSYSMTMSVFTGGTSMLMFLVGAYAYLKVRGRL